MKMKGAIFDLDGTLLDSMPVWENIGEDYLRGKGQTPSPNLRETLKPMSLLQVAQHFRSDYHISDSEEEIRAQINAMLESAYYHTVPLKATVNPFLQELKTRGVKMCVATATDRHLVEAALERLGVATYFCGIITCYEAGAGKDRPDAFHQALALLETDSNETVVFEDALHAIQTAKLAGFWVAGVYDHSAQMDQAKIVSTVDWYLNSFAEWEFA